MTFLKEFVNVLSVASISFILLSAVFAFVVWFNLLDGTIRSKAGAGFIVLGAVLAGAGLWIRPLLYLAMAYFLAMWGLSSLGPRLWARVLLLGSHERPDFIALDTDGLQAANMLVVVDCTYGAQVAQELENSGFRYSRHADGRVDAVPLDQSGNHPNPLCCAEPIHDSRPLHRARRAVKYG